MSTVCRWGMSRMPKTLSVTESEQPGPSNESLDNKSWQWNWPWARTNNRGSVPLNEAQLKSWFTLFDANKDGRLSKEELKNALEGLGSTFPAWRAWRALRHADENGDGYISEEELDGLVKYIVKRGYSPSKWPERV